jgi:hypothetical protein
MYTRVNWEAVNSIKATCTSVIVPNLRLYCVLLMYIDVQRWTIITTQKKKARGLSPSRALCIVVIHSLDHPLVEVRCWPFIHCWREASA